MKSELRFECTQCGKCCTSRGEYAYVYLNRSEIDALADYLEMSVDRFKRKYTFVDEDGWTQLNFTKEHCIFLDPKTNGCEVYGARPIQCSTFPFWRSMVKDGKWTPQVAELCEGIGRGATYSLEEAEVRMQEYEESDED